MKFFTMNKSLYNVVLLLLDILKKTVLPDLIRNRLFGFVSTLALILPDVILFKLKPGTYEADKAQLDVPYNEPVRLFIVAEPVILKEPDTLTVPINVWVSFVASPNIFEPLLNIIEEVIV